ncbi:MAG: DUF4911 domain-containing protein [Desulfovibrionaceae bacterium]|nr:DUF4911 domain-containing protein [Desulfovibrionaceae bacterium]
MFRFLLEAHAHLAYFTVLERQTALLKLSYPIMREAQVLKTLDEMAASVSFTVKPWPRFQ